MDRIIKSRLIQDIEKKINEKTIKNSYDLKNYEIKRSMDVSNATIYEIANLLATLIEDLKNANIIKR